MLGYKFYNFLFVILMISFCQAWNYEEQDKWPTVRCQKSITQSPIALEDKNVTPIYMAPLSFFNWNQEYRLSVMNNGHTINVNFPPTNHISVSGGGLPGTYIITQFHFHWGSEHTLNGKRRALEAHFVGFNDKFSSLEEALEYANGIAVVAVLYDLSCQDNPILQTIVQNIDILENVNQMTFITMNPANLLPNNVMCFYRYYGSLTTPNCNDVVVWTIFSELSTVSKNQLDKFRSISNSEGGILTKNFRCLQPLNGRIVYKVSA